MQTLFIVGLLVLLVGLIAQAGIQSIGPSAYRAALRIYAKVIAAIPTIATSAVTASSAIVTLPAGVVAVLRTGMFINGAGFPAGSSIVQINATANTVTMSNPTGITGTFQVTFTDTQFEGVIHLYKAPFAGGGDPTPASFTEADFTGYVPLSLKGTPVYSLPDGSAETDSGDAAWVLTATPTVGNTIYGYWVDYVDPDNPANSIVAVREDLPNPLPMNVVGNAVVLSIPIKMPTVGSAFVS